MDLELIRKYNVTGPRYTSYPTAVQFEEADEDGIKKLKHYLKKHNREPRPISLYFHIPFCFSLCWYCGCTKVITRNQDRGDLYLDYLEKEMDQIAGMLHPDSEVIQIHFGGGTPTFLKPKQLMRLGMAVRQRFNLGEEAEFGVEIDPRRCTEAHIKVLKKIGCNRASLGVQDTNPEVQEAIHRIQPFEQTKKITKWLHEEGICSINFDLIYGLPKQTLDTLRQTMDDVLQLSPDRMALYSYAHLPQIMPSQKLLNAEEMPTADEKLAMLQLSIDHLTGHGYRFIGMDHFSKKGGELAKALDEGTLQRNFQGYGTRSGADLYAFGMSGISSVGNWYWQNSKDLNDYYAYLEESKLPVVKLLKLSRDDRLRKNVIMQLMCQTKLLISPIEQEWDINFEIYFEEELRKLKKLEKDHLVRMTDYTIRITKEGRLFLRNIAMCFDSNLSTANKNLNFSKTV